MSVPWTYNYGAIVLYRLISRPLVARDLGVIESGVSLSSVTGRHLHIVVRATPSARPFAVDCPLLPALGTRFVENGHARRVPLGELFFRGVRPRALATLARSRRRAAAARTAHRSILQSRASCLSRRESFDNMFGRATRRVALMTRAPTSLLR